MTNQKFLISNFRHVLNVVCFLLGYSLRVCSLNANVSEHSVPTSYASRYEVWPWFRKYVRRPLCGSLLPQPVFSTCSHPEYPPPERLRLFFEPFHVLSQPQSHFIPTSLWRWNG
jgi:hypothetical protein